MATYKTPGVYIEEISKLPASVASVETAIPAFIGYTEMARDPGGRSLNLKPTRISSLVEYNALFGGAPDLDISRIGLDDQGRVVSTDAAQKFYMYDAIRLFFANGGGDCYIISVNLYIAPSGPQKDDFIAGLGKLAREDEPTLILVPDAVLLDAGGFNAVQQAALLQCAELQDRFCIFDLQESDGWESGVNAFRNDIGINNLKYGAAYTPYIRTSLDRKLSYKDLKEHLKQPLGDDADLKTYTSDPAIQAAVDQLENALTDSDTVAADIAGFLASPPAGISGTINSIAAGYSSLAKDLHDPTGNPSITTVKSRFKNLIGYNYHLLNLLFNKWETGTPFTGMLMNDLKEILDGDLRNGFESSCLWPLILIDNTGNLAAPPPPHAPFGTNTDYPVWKVTFSSLTTVAPWNGTFRDLPADVNIAALKYPAIPNPGDNNERKANMRAVEPLIAQVFEKINGYINQIAALSQQRLDEAQATLAAVYPVFGNIIQAIKKELQPVPPGGAIAGVYATVDATRGVWKAPANVSLNSVAGLTETIDDNTQQGLNVDVTGGKSINALRFFRGKGHLVWGARTLAGNDNEWRYVPVRRLFNMVEESIKKATEFVVFEPNDANTWTRVKGMIDNYLTTLWRDGALAGSKPNEAFFVNVGLGVTMTAQDILEGRMIVEIGMAAVRPAEFIILQFSHLLQTS